MNLAELRPLLLLQHGGTLIKVSTIYPAEERFTATVCIEQGRAPERTTVRSYPSSSLPLFGPPTKAMMHKYDGTYGPVGREEKT